MAYLATNNLVLLFLWEGVATAYLIVGLIVAWNTKRPRASPGAEARKIARWLWVPPLLAALVGTNAAITALSARQDAAPGADSTLLAVTASLGIVVSWALLHVGFAQAYAVLSDLSRTPELEFPGDHPPQTIDYMYFAFTVGTSFATSDILVQGRKTRRVALIHSVVAFFYNALVVAVAFQVLQGSLTA